MMNTYKNVSSAIETIDLSQIAARFKKQYRISDSNVEVAEAEYRRFLHMVLQYPHSNIVPTKLVDLFWHVHILDTRLYSSHCDLIFGEYLHHNPNFGASTNSQDIVVYKAAIVSTEHLYVELFGTTPATKVIEAGHRLFGFSECNQSDEVDSPVERNSLYGLGECDASVGEERVDKALVHSTYSDMDPISFSDCNPGGENKSV